MFEYYMINCEMQLINWLNTIWLIENAVSQLHDSMWTWSIPGMRHWSVSTCYYHVIAKHSMSLTMTHDRSMWWTFLQVNANSMLMLIPTHWHSNLWFGQSILIQYDGHIESLMDHARISMTHYLRYTYTQIHIHTHPCIHQWRIMSCHSNKHV